MAHSVDKTLCVLRAPSVFSVLLLYAAIFVVRRPRGARRQL